MQFTAENETRFSQCLMYDVNYPMINVSEMDLTGLEALDQVPCKHGWDYGGEDVENSIISEVNPGYLVGHSAEEVIFSGIWYVARTLPRR